jgi:hypothetical protein
VDGEDGWWRWVMGDDAKRVMCSRCQQLAHSVFPQLPQKHGVIGFFDFNLKKKHQRFFIMPFLKLKNFEFVTLNGKQVIIRSKRARLWNKYPRSLLC